MVYNRTSRPRVLGRLVRFLSAREYEEGYFVYRHQFGRVYSRPRRRGGLAGQSDDVQTEGSYPAFVKDIDTVVMGWRTYEQVVTELAPDDWPYGGLTTYVVTHRKSGREGDVRFTDEKPADLVRRLRLEGGRGIRICGGANLVGQLMDEDVIDRWHISVIPILLGGGLRLFDERDKRVALRLTGMCAYDGIVDLVYERR